MKDTRLKYQRQLIHAALFCLGYTACLFPTYGFIEMPGLAIIDDTSFITVFQGLETRFQSIDKQSVLKSTVSYGIIPALIAFAYLCVLRCCDMVAKLALKLDKFVIDKAKEYASLHKKSLSRMIKSYIKTLIDKENQQPDNDIEISPFVKRMKTGVKLPVDFDYKKEYGDYIAEKYK